MRAYSVKLFENLQFDIDINMGLYMMNSKYGQFTQVQFHLYFVFT